MRNDSGWNRQEQPWKDRRSVIVINEQKDQKLNNAYNKEESYQMTMYFVRRMREKGLLTDVEYEAIDTRMRQKYQPIFVKFIEQI